MRYSVLLLVSCYGCAIQRANTAFFKSSCKMHLTVVFSIPVLSTIILRLTQQSFFKTCSICVMFSKFFVVDLPLPSLFLTDSLTLWIVHAIEMLLHETQLTGQMLFKCFHNCFCHIITKFYTKLNYGTLI